MMFGYGKKGTKIKKNRWMQIKLTKMLNMINENVGKSEGRV